LKYIEHEYGYGYEIIPVTQWGWEWDKRLIPVGSGYEDGDEIFLQGWVWDSETCSRLAPLSSLTRATRASIDATVVGAGADCFVRSEPKGNVSMRKRSFVQHRCPDEESNDEGFLLQD